MAKRQRGLLSIPGVFNENHVLSGIFVQQKERQERLPCSLPAVLLSALPSAVERERERETGVGEGRIPTHITKRDINRVVFTKQQIQSHN